MKKFLSLICVMLLLASCASKPQEEVKPEETTPEEEPVVETVSLVETTVPSTTRDAAIPAYFTVPKENPTSVAVLIHGHHGNHNEWGGYDVLAKRYMTYRMRLESWIYNKVYKPIAQVQGFYRPLTGEMSLAHATPRQIKKMAANKELEEEQ